jgi:uncharacterized protein (TIGR01777 family)
VIAGGSGFIGRALARELLAGDFEVVVLTRSPRKQTGGIREVFWDGKNSGEWVQVLDGAEAVVNLAGRNIKCPHTPENLRELTASRVDSVLAIAAAFHQCEANSAARLGAGGCHRILWRPTRPVVRRKFSGMGDDTLAGICKPWEAAFNSASAPDTRRVLLRIGFVLGRDGGALPLLAGLTKWFLGGTVGSGRQFISWIHVADLTRMFIEASSATNWPAHSTPSAQTPVTNREFMRELRRALHRPWSPPAPEWAVRLGARLMGTEPSLALTGCRCRPETISSKPDSNSNFPNFPAR